MADTLARFELRPMRIGDILDTAFRLYQANFARFLTISLIVYVPYTLVVLLLMAGAAQAPTYAYEPSVGKQQVSPAAMAVGALATMLFSIVVLPLVYGALTYSISAHFLGESETAGASFRRAGRRWLPLVGTQLLGGIVVMLGFILCIVPGVIFSLWFLLITPVVLLDRQAGTKGLGRSRALMRGNLGKGFVLSLVVTILSLVISFGASAVLHAARITSPIVNQTVENLIQAVILPLLVAPYVLLYYDLRVRKEAFDLERLAATLAGAPLPELPRCVAPGCGQVNRAGAEYCSRCGGALPVVPPAPGGGPPAS